MKNPFTITVQYSFPTYGRLLKFVRESKRLSQTELAKKAKTKQSAIARIETNDKYEPSLTVMKKISLALGLSMEAPYFACKKCKKRISDCKCKK